MVYDACALEDWLQQKCVAHLLREVRELAESKRGRARQYAVELMSLLRDGLTLKAEASDLWAVVRACLSSELYVKRVPRKTQNVNRKARNVESRT